MDKIKFLNNAIEKHFNSYSDGAIILALINSLSPKEAVDFFDLSFENNPKIREWTAKKISKDIGNKKEKFHTLFLKKIITKLKSKKFRHRNTCAYTLDILIENLNKSEKRKTINFLINSEYTVLRRKGYKHLVSNIDKYYLKNIEQTFENYCDEYIVGIILNHSSDSFIVENYKDLFSCSNEFQKGKLFLKVTKYKPELINDLKDNDEITYSYVIAKNNLVLTDEEAKTLIANNEKDERFSLLIWSIGQLGKWEVLKEYYEKKHSR